MAHYTPLLSAGLLLSLSACMTAHETSYVDNLDCTDMAAFNTTDPTSGNVIIEGWERQERKARTAKGQLTDRTSHERVNSYVRREYARRCN